MDTASRASMRKIVLDSPSAQRIRLKRVGRACGVALRATETVLFGPFWPPYTAQIHASSVARTPFRIVSELGFSHLGAQQTASVKLSIGTPETSYELPTRTDPKNVSLRPGRVRRLRRAVRGA